MKQAASEASLKPYLIRFSIAYLIGVIVVATAIALFDLKRGSTFNVAILMSSAYYAAAKFVEENRRIFVGGEFGRMFAGSLAIDLVFQIVLVMFTAPKLVPTGVFAGAMLLVALIHAPGLAFMYSKWLMSRIEAGFEKKRLAAARKRVRSR